MLECLCALAHVHERPICIKSRDSNLVLHHRSPDETVDEQGDNKGKDSGADPKLPQEGQGKAGRHRVGRHEDREGSKVAAGTVGNHVCSGRLAALGRPASHPLEQAVIPEHALGSPLLLHVAGGVPEAKHHLNISLSHTPIMGHDGTGHHGTTKDVAGVCTIMPWQDAIHVLQYQADDDDTLLSLDHFIQLYSRDMRAEWRICVKNFGEVVNPSQVKRGALEFKVGEGQVELPGWRYQKASEVFNRLQKHGAS